MLCRTHLLIHTISPEKVPRSKETLSTPPLQFSIVVPGGHGEHAKTDVTTHFVTCRCDFQLAHAWVPACLRDPGSKAAAPILCRHSETWAGAVFQSCSCIASLCLPGSVPLFIGRPPLHTQREKVGSPFQAYTRVTGKGVGRRRCSHGAMRRLGSKAEFEGEESTNLDITISPSVWRAQRMNRCQLLVQSASLKRP